jgi:hypothetical protein
LVGGDVVDRVGCGCARVYDDVADELAVEEGFDAEVEVLLRAGDRRTQVGVSYLDGGGVVAVDSDHRRSRGGVGRRSIVFIALRVLIRIDQRFARIDSRLCRLEAGRK